MKKENERQSGGRYVSTDKDPKRTFLRDFGSNARSALPKLPLAAAQPQTVSQANTTLLPYLSFSLSLIHARTHAPKHARTHARTHTHTHRQTLTYTRRHTHIYVEGNRLNVCVCEMGGGWPHTSGTVILAPSVRLFFSTLYFQTHKQTHTHTHTLLQLDGVEQGWVGVLWLNAFPVMLHRQPSGLFSDYWLSLAVHLCLGAAHRTAARDTSVNVVEKDLNHILVMRNEARLVLLSPDGRVQNRDDSTSWYNGGVRKSRRRSSTPSTYWAWKPDLTIVDL